MQSVELGDLVKCRVSGLTGIAVVKSEFLNGCTQIEVQPRMTSKDSKIPDSIGIDIQQLIVVKKDAIGRNVAEKKPAKKKANGGPMHSSIRMRGY